MNCIKTLKGCKAQSHYKRFVACAKEKCKATAKEILELEDKLKESYEYLNKFKDVIKTSLNIDLDSYSDFVNKKYKDGKFLRVAKGLFISKDKSYEKIADVTTIYATATLQKTLSEHYKLLEKYKKEIGITRLDYINLLKRYMIEVHKQMIIEANAYRFSKMVGGVCINRVLYPEPKKYLDYRATANAKNKLIAEGKPVYNSYEKCWCEEHNIEYNVQPYKVFVTHYCKYEFAILYNHIKGRKIKFKYLFWRLRSLVGSNQELADKYKTIEAVCELPLDVKQKLPICLLLNNKLYSKYIRNESQKSITNIKSNRKSRQ